MRWWTRTGGYVAAMVVAAFILRLALLSTRGDYLEFDEAFYLLIARSLLSGNGLAFNGLPEIAFPPLPALLLALFQKLTGAMLAPSRIASALFGALLVVPVHRACRWWLGRRAALVAAACTAVSPTMLTFLPLALPPHRRLYFGHEPLYLLCLFMAVWSLIGVLRRPSFEKGAAFGCAAALSYLTRNESILFGGPAVLLVALQAWSAPAGPSRTRALSASAAAAALFAAVALPYPIYLHRVTGEWTVSGKTGTAALIRPTVVAWVRDGDFYSYEKTLYALAPSGDRMMSSYWGYAGQEAEGDLGLSVSGVLDNLDVYTTIALPTLLPWPTWPFLIAGLAAPALHRFRGRSSPRPRGALPIRAAFALLLLPSLVVCLVLFVEPRHHLYLSPLGLMVAGRGAVEVGRWVGGRRATLALASLLTGSLLALALLPLAELKRDDAIRPEAAKQRKMGEILSREIPPAEPVASYHPALAWWADRDWRVLPASGFPQMVAYAVRRGIRTLVLERGVFGPLPGEPAGPGSPFAVVIIEGVSAGEAERGLYRLDRLESNDLFSHTRLLGLAAPPHGR